MPTKTLVIESHTSHSEPAEQVEDAVVAAYWSARRGLQMRFKGTAPGALA